jgi:hypothetical protein
MLGTPPLKIVSPENEVDEICSDMQSRHRSGIGMLLLLIKHSRTNICIVVKEMSKYINGASGAARTFKKPFFILGDLIQMTFKLITTWLLQNY